jgi:OOP family OmpA-OmpF porin
MIGRTTLFAALVVASSAVALDLPASARMTAERVTERDRYNAPVAPFDGATIPVQSLDGQIVRRTWRLSGVNFTPLQILEPLHAQYEAEGYETILDCMADRCGGFDFRFGIEVLPAPAIFVNLQNFQFLTLRKGSAAAPEAIVSLLASSAPNVAHLQIIEARAREGAGLLDVATIEPEDPVVLERDHAPSEPVNTLQDDLETHGFHVLDGLEFETGATALGPGPFTVLADLATYLTENPGVRIALVGHTDVVGGLDQNLLISKDRARSVRQRLIDAYGIAPRRLDAEGIAYLAPRASNRTANGRQFNRRVEAVIVNTDDGSEIE